MEWSTKIEISDKPPAEYWPAQCEAKQFTGERLAAQEQAHALPEDWTSPGHEDFLVQRRRFLARVTREGYRRLADPNYTPDLTVDPSAAPETRLDALTLEELVLEGHLPSGVQVVGGDADRQFVGEITDEGILRVGTHAYDGPTQAARELGADVDDGWEFWAVQPDDGDEPIALAEVRARASGATA